MNEGTGSAPLAGFVRVEPQLSMGSGSDTASLPNAKPPTRLARLRKRKQVKREAALTDGGGRQSPREAVAAPKAVISRKQLRKLERKIRREAEREAQAAIAAKIRAGKIQVPKESLPDEPADTLSSRLLVDGGASREDASLISEARRKRWPISDEKRAAIVQRLIARAEITASDAVLLGTAKELRMMEGQNQADEFKEMASDDPRVNNLTQNNVVIYIPDNGRDPV